MSATPDSTLVNPEQRIADLERQLAEREAELAEAHEQQTATAEVLQVINSSPGDLAPVFDAMLEKALHLCGAAFGTLFTYDGALFHTMAYRGEAAYGDYLRRGSPFHPERAVTFQRLVRGADIVHIADVLEDEAYRGGKTSREAVEVSGMRTLVSVALRKDGGLLGTVAVYRQEVRPFTDKQIALLQNFAAQAVIAMENARLITETREALEQQTATAEILQVINSSPGDLLPVFDALLEKARLACGAPHGDLWIRDGDELQLAATHGDAGFAEWLWRHPRMPLWKGSPPERVVRGEQHVQFDDAREDASFQLVPEFLEQVERAGLRSTLLVPLRREGAVLGIIVVYRCEIRRFTDKQIALLQNFAAQAVIAMENARLLTETREALEQQTATAEVLQVINSSPGDLAPVFYAILEKAMRLCEAAFGMLHTHDGKAVRLVAKRGLPPRFAEYTENPSSQPGPGGATPRLIAGARFVHIVDLKEEEAYRSGEPYRLALVDIAGARTLLAVPLRRDGNFLGQISVYRQQVHPYNDKQIALLENFAAQAVIAMENARLLGELHERTDQVAELNRGLEARVAEQVEELGRVGRLKRFLAPQLAELIVSQGDEKILESHRREVVVVFCDLRGYTAFTETAEPEEVLDFLREYHGALGPLVSQFEGTLDQFSGDGIMVFFNDPVPCTDPAERAVKMTLAMREAAAKLVAAWRRRGRELGFGAGIAQGYATLGQIGFAERSGYTAIGTVCNVAARLCAEAKDGQILLSQRVAVAVEGATTLEEIGALTLKGLTQPVVAYNVPLATSQPALRVIEGGPQSV